MTLALHHLARCPYEFPAEVTLRDVTLRDGLQSIPTILPTPAKLDIFHALTSAGIQNLQITSLVSPQVVPQVADAAALWGELMHRSERMSVMVANLRGFERAVKMGVREIEAVVSLSDTYNRKNANRTTRDSLNEAMAMAARSKNVGCTFSVALANIYHCTFEGWTDPGFVLDTVEELHRHGVGEIILCDTTGYATPDRVFHLSLSALQRFPALTLGAHLHDTLGRGIANAIAALGAGIAWFDTAMAGLGGPLFASGIGGNLSTEALVEILTEMNVRTGIDPRRIRAVSETVHTLTQL